MYKLTSPCLLLLALASAHVDGAKNQKEVIVIGAGVAGATVARQLSNDPAGRFTVTVLEGRQDRLGGRLWTETSSPGALGADADLGGSFIDATDPQSSLVQLIKNFELTLFEPGPLEIRSPDGKFERHDFADLGETIQRHLIKKIQSALVSKHSETDFSAQEALDSDTKGEALDDALWDVVLSGLIEPVFGTQLQNLSASMFQVEKLSPGFAIMEGANEIVNRLISGWENRQRELPETTIPVEMGKIVRQIHVDRKKKKVKVRTKDRKSLTADIVVVAVPLSTLQNGELFFDPPLSVERQNAIKQTGVGHLNKVILRFEEMFWDNEPEMFAPTAEALRSSKPLIPSWINAHRYTGAPALVGYLPGEAAQRMEDMDGDTLQDEALKSLECIFGKTILNQKLVSIQRSAWSRDPLAGGSASFYSVGNTAEMRKNLFRPVCPYLYFAGEYATLDKPGTIEGAYLSGLDVADQIMNGCRSEEKQRKKSSSREEL